MAVAEDVRLAPTLDDAERAAAACMADPRVRKVSVFGSVARGEATPHSDIDLLVLVDPAWGKRIREFADSLSRDARQAAGHYCDLTLRTPAAWRHMSENVSASFEAYISGETVELRTSDFDENEGRADEMGNRQMTNDDLVAGALRSVSRHLAGLKRTLRDIPLDNQDMSSAEVAPDMREMHSAGRHVALLVHAHHGIELSIKAVGMADENRALPKTHDLHALVEGLSASEAKQQLAELVDALRSGQDGRLLNWRLGTYADIEDEWADYITLDNANRHILAFLSTAETAAQAAKRRGESPSISSAGDEVFRVAASIRSMNITPDYLLYGAAQAKRPGLLARLFRRRDIPPTGTVPTAAPMPASGSAISHDALAANAPPQEKISCGEAMPRAERPASDPLPAGGGGSDEPFG